MRRRDLRTRLIMAMPKKMNVLIACGGTGGHLFPGIAVAEALEKRGHQVLLLISEKKVDAQASKKYGMLNFITVPAIAKPPTLSLRMIPFLFRLRKSIKQCRKIIKDHECDVVLGMGGFTSLPPIYAGKKLRRATYVHDSNALPGKANRITARWCRHVLLGLEAASPYFKKKKVIVTGTPVRRELTAPLRQDRARVTFSLPSDGKAVLIMGGSQGAKHLNTLVVKTAKALQKINLPPKSTPQSSEKHKAGAVTAAQPMGPPDATTTRSAQLKTRAVKAAKVMPKTRFLHITGTGDFDRVSERAKDIEGYKVLSFCDDMASAYAACDVAICRAGASSMTELSYAGMPSILVPYPYAADDHQTFNAEVFEKAGAAILRQESDLDASTLVTDLTQILQDDSVHSAMSQHANNLAVKDAAEQICNVITQSSPR